MANPDNFPVRIEVPAGPITVEGTTVGWVEGPRPASAIAAVVAYAAAREADKRALSREALDRYRELNLIYDLAEQIGATLEIDAVAAVAVEEASRLPTGGEGFIVLRDGAGPLLDRIADLARHFTGTGIGCDLIVYTEAERQRLLARGDAFARAIFDEGILLARR